MLKQIWKVMLTSITIPIIAAPVFAHVESVISSKSRDTIQNVQALSLRDAIFVALYNNRDIRSAYIGRVSDRYRLRVDRDLFVPDLNISVSTGANTFGDPPNRELTRRGAISSQFRALVPTGGQFSVTWGNDLRRLNAPGFDGQTDSSSNVNIAFVQPLLRGGGIKVTRAPLDIAELGERINILGLKNTVMNTVTSTIQSYRGLLLQQRQLGITELSLERAKTLVKTTQKLIEAGRTAPQDLVQAQTTVSQRELDLEGAKNALDSARLDLLDVLDIDPETQFRLTENLDTGEIPDVSFKEAFDIAMHNQPSYLQTLLQNELSKISLRLAKNNRLLDLNLELSASYRGFNNGSLGGALEELNKDRPDHAASLVLNIPFGDRSRRANLVSAQAARRQQELSLKETKDALRITVLNQLRALRSLKAQVGLATRTEALARKQLDVEKLKLERGRSTNFQVLNFEDQLIGAQLSAASLASNYLNALSRLDLILGTTLDTWQLPFHVQRYTAADLRSERNFQQATQKSIKHATPGGLNATLE